MYLHKSIYYRFEENIGDGILYIYDYDKGIIFKSNEFSYFILKSIDNGVTINDLINSIKLIYSEYTEEKVKEHIEKVVKFFEINNIICY